MNIAKDVIRETLDQAKAYLGQDSPPKLSEADTKIHFIEPIIAALGWQGLGVVTREYFVKTSHEYIDFMMIVDGQKLLAIEAKPLQAPLSEKNAAQLVQYCAVEGVEWAALTNGQELQFFNTFLKPDLEAKRVLSLELLGYSNDEEFDSLVQNLSQLSQQSISTRAANSWLTQRRMDATLRAVLLDPNSAAIKSMRKALADTEIKATGSEIVHWARTHLASKPAAPKKTTVSSFPPLQGTPEPKQKQQSTFDPLDSHIFQGSHQHLLPAFQALKARVDAIAPGSNWRVLKHYIAAAYEDKTFLSIKRRASSLVIGVTYPPEQYFPLPDYDIRLFKWSRITRAFAISVPEDVTDETVRVLQLSIQNATSSQNPDRQHFGTTLKHLLDAELIRPSELLILMKGGTKITEATLDPSGRIAWRENLYASPSDRAFTLAMGRKSMNGWTHWFVKREQGLVSLTTLRQQLQADTAPAAGAITG